MNVKTVLLATDFSDCSEVAARYAMSLARDAGARLHVVHVIESSSHGSGGLVDMNDSLLKQMLDELVAEEPNIQHESHLLVGDPTNEILHYVKDNQINIAVVGTHGRSGMSRLLTGSVAEALLRRAPCPVLTVKSTESITEGVS